jgi:outer membrane protein assembly factor BamA
MRHAFILLALVVPSLHGLYAQSFQLDRVEVEGLDRTHRSFFNGIAHVGAGDSTDVAALEEMRKWLVLQPAFNVVEYTLDTVGQKQVLRWQVEEARTILPYVGLWSSDDITTVLAGLSEFNLLGRGISVGAFYQYNLRHSLGLFYRHPFLLGQFGTELSYTLWNSYEPLYKGPATAFYDYSNSSVNATLLYMPNRRQEWQAGLSLFREQYALGTVSEEDRPLFPRQLDINKLGIRLNHLYRGAVPRYFYWSGFSVDTYAQVVLDEFGTDPFYIIRQSLRYYRRSGERGNIALRLLWGLSSNVNSPFAPFALDNHISIRGVGDRIDRGTGVLTLNTEYRHMFYESNVLGLQGVGFVDVGSWRLPGGPLSDFVEPDVIRLHAGLGARLILKQFYNTVLSVDYGHSLRRDGVGGFVMGLGQYF